MNIETAIVSYIEPHAGYARAFNRWYEDDHFPSAVLAGPGVVSGARFVATVACKKLRPPGALFGDPAIGSYLAVAWVDRGRQHEWDAWVMREMEHLTAAGRLFPQRDHVHTAVYRYVSGDPVPDAGGVVAVATTGPPADLAVGGVSGTVLLALDRTIVSAVAPPAHTLQLAFCTADPLDVFARVTIPTSVGFASPFLATIPGTDTYTEEL